jgi:hypothetical protein
MKLKDSSEMEKRALSEISIAFSPTDKSFGFMANVAGKTSAYCKVLAHITNI